MLLWEGLLPLLALVRARPSQNLTRRKRWGGGKRSFSETPIPFAPGSSPHVSSWLLPSRFPACSTKPCPPPCHPRRPPPPVPPRHPIAACISNGTSIFPGHRKKRFPGFSPQISPVEDASGWVLPGLIEIRIRVSWLALSPADRRPEPLQTSCFVLIRHRAAPQAPPASAEPHSQAGNEG